MVGEAWLFLSLQLLAYAGAMAILFHLFVIGYEGQVARTAALRPTAFGRRADFAVRVFWVAIVFRVL